MVLQYKGEFYVFSDNYVLHIFHPGWNVPGGSTSKVTLSLSGDWDPIY